MALSLSVTRPAFIAELCTRCNVCVESCPVDALRLGEERPEVVDELCIGCYCCHELCPSRAVTLEHRHWLGRGLFGETRRERRRRGHADVKEGEEENPS
jgi:MinD superfamily P-loop ATPase